MAQHTFSFPPAASGLSYTIHDQEGSPVASGTLGSDDDVVVLRANLPWADAYIARAGEFSAQGEVQEEAPGVSETAYLFATGITATDSEYVDAVLEGEDLPDWVSIVDGEAVLSEAAGGCVASIIGQADMDFSGTSRPTGDSSGADWTLSRNGTTLTSSESHVAEVEDDQVVLDVGAPVGAFVFGGTLAVKLDAYAGGGEGAVTDGVVTHRVAVNVTRVAPSPTLD